MNELNLLRIICKNVDPKYRYLLLLFWDLDFRQLSNELRKWQFVTFKFYQCRFSFVR